MLAIERKNSHHVEQTVKVRNFEGPSCYDLKGVDRLKLISAMLPIA
jgi:hypothetical protein